jgi:C1A family cysteine protease
MAHNITWYGWQPDLPDHRDLTYAAPAALVRRLPNKVDLRNSCPPVYDQGQLGSCTGNAIAAAFEFELMKQGKAMPFTPSRLFIYYNERVIEHTVNTDAGAQIRDGIKSVHKQGVCPENMLPYHVSQFAKKPNPACYAAALKNLVLSYHRVSRPLVK